MSISKKDKNQLAPISKERLENSLEKANKIEHIIDSLVQKFVNIFPTSEEFSAFEFFSTLKRFDKIFNICLTEICNDLDLLGITFHNISLRRIYQFGKISCTSFLKKTLEFYERRLNNNNFETIQEQEMRKIKFFEEQLNEFIEYLKETKRLAKKTKSNDQIFDNQAKTMDRYEKMEKLRFLIEQEGYEIDQLINKIKGGEKEIDDLLFKSQQNLAKINGSGATEILESIRFKSLFDKNNLDFIALLKLAEKKSEQLNNQDHTSKKFIEEMTKSILKTIKKTQNKKKIREGKLFSMEEIDIPQEKAIQANYEEIIDHPEKIIHSPEYINGLNTYVDDVLRKANMIEIQKKSLEKEKIEFELKLKERDFRLKERLDKIYKKRMKIKELKKTIAELKEKLNQSTYSEINLQSKVKEKEESINKIKILLQKKVEQSAADLQEFNKTVKFLEKQIKDGNSKLEELNLKRNPSVQFIEKKNLINGLIFEDQGQNSSRGFNLDTLVSPTKRLFSRKSSMLIINHQFCNDTGPSSSKLKRVSTINQFSNIKEMPKSSGKKLSNFGDQHKTLIRRSKTSNFLALKEEEIEKFSQTSLDSKSKIFHISEESRNSFKNILKHDTEHNRLDSSKSNSITSAFEKNENHVNAILEEDKRKNQMVQEMRIKTNKSQTFHSSKSNASSLNRKEEVKLNECVDKIKRFEKGHLLLTISFLEKMLHIQDKKLFFLKIDNFLIKYDQIKLTQFTQTEEKTKIMKNEVTQSDYEGKEQVSKSIQIDPFKENGETRPKTGVILKLKSMSQHQITPIKPETKFIVKKIELEKPKATNEILLSLATPKPTDMDNINPISSNFLYNKTFETTPNVKIKHRKSFSLFFKNFEKTETLHEEKKIENFLINLKRKKSSSIQISSEKETTKIPSNNDLTRSLSSFKYPFKKLNNEIDKEGMEQLNSLVEELYKKHRKCGKFCEHMRKFFQKINLLGFGDKKILALHNKYIDKLPNTFY